MLTVSMCNMLTFAKAIPQITADVDKAMTEYVHLTK